MQSIELFVVPDEPESNVSLPVGVKLIDAHTNYLEDSDEISVYYMDPGESDETLNITFYVLFDGAEVGDTFPGSYFKKVRMSDGTLRFIFFKIDRKKRAPIVVEVPDAEPKKKAA